MASVVSRFKCRIKPFQFHARVVGSELPIDFGPQPVARSLPSRHFVAQDVDGIDASVETLADHDVEFDLGDIQPTAVLRSMDELEPVPQRLGLRRRESFVECAGAVSAQIVHDQGDFPGVGVVRGDIGEKVRPVDLGLAFGHLGQALAGQRFGGHEDVAHPAAPVLVVVALGLSRVAPGLARASRGSTDGASRPCTPPDTPGRKAADRPRAPVPSPPRSARCAAGESPTRRASKV